MFGEMAELDLGGVEAGYSEEDGDDWGEEPAGVEGEDWEDEDGASDHAVGEGDDGHPV